MEVMRQHVGQGFNELSGTRISDSIKETVRKRLDLPGFLKIHRRLGDGCAGTVYSIYMNHPQGRRWWALKEVSLPTARHEKRFREEVAFQELFAAGDCALRVDNAYISHQGEDRYGVLTMAPIDGVLGDVILQNHHMPRALTKRFYLHIAHEVKRLYELLQSQRWAHGDMHFANIAIRFMKGSVGAPPKHADAFPRLVFLDTGRSFRMTDQLVFTDEGGVSGREKQMLLEDADRYWVWRAATHPLLNEALRKVGFPGSTIMKEAVGHSRPAPEDLLPTERLDATNWRADLLLNLQASIHDQLLPPAPALPHKGARGSSAS